MLHHHHLGEELKVSRQKNVLSTTTLCHTKDTARCKLERLSELFHHGAIALNPHTHTIIDPSTPAVLQKNTLVTMPMKNIVLGHFVWGPHLSPHSTKDSDIWNCYRNNTSVQPVIEITTTPCASAQALQHPWACHTCFSKENQVHNYMHARIKFHAYSDIKVNTEIVSRKERERLSEIYA
jgi:hypothetical protein